MVSCTGILVTLYIFNILLFMILFVKLRKRKGTCQYESIKRKIANDEELGEIIQEEITDQGLSKMDVGKLGVYADTVATLKAASEQQQTEDQTKNYRMSTAKLEEIQRELIRRHATKRAGERASRTYLATTI